MKPLVSLGRCAAAVLAASTAAPHAAESHAPPLAWYHAAGATRIAADANSATLRKLAALPEWRVLRDQVWTKLQQAPFAALRRDLPKDAQQLPDLWRPLIGDVFGAESVGAVRHTGGRHEVALAVRLPEAKAALWNSNIAAIARAWKLPKPAPLSVPNASGWETRAPAGAVGVQLARVRQWTVIGLGQAPLTLAPAWVEVIARSGQPAPPLEDSWLEVRLDLPRLGRAFPGLAALGLAPAEVRVVPKDGVLRTTARLRFPGKLAWTHEPWNIPTNLVTEPLISFMVAQGIAPWLKRLPGFSELGLETVPNQVALWGQVNPHVQSIATWPVPDATNAMERLHRTLPGWMQRHCQVAPGAFLWVSNAHTIVCRAVPFVFPSLSPLTDEDQQYLLSCFFPPVAITNPPPPELYAQFLGPGTTNLFYYHWELTSERLPQMSRLWQLIDIARNRVLPSSNQPSVRWLLAAAPLLGNASTEARQTAERDVTVTRRSHLGLTALEIATLLRWVDSSGFPLTFAPPPAFKHNPPPAAAPTPSPKPRPPGKINPRTP
ncbi:MAG: hypothetical protein JXQ71_08650 [Verrucomicrobia bacterium]|nr:hypothetical protein [Verrucomicrobiota bacterium]